MIEGKLSQITIELDNKFSEMESEEVEHEKKNINKPQKGITNNQVLR